MWTGKQVVSTILLNVTEKFRDGNVGISMDGKSKTPGHAWGPKCEEDEVIIREGELLCGVLDKSQFGATSYG